MVAIDSEDLVDVSKLWAGSHVFLAALIFGLSRVQSADIAVYGAVLVLVALAIEYVTGHVGVVRRKRGS